MQFGSPKPMVKTKDPVQLQSHDGLTQIGEIMKTLRDEMDRFAQLQTEIIAEPEVDAGVDSSEYPVDVHMGEPTPEQLVKINRLVGRESSASEWFVFACRASDALVNADYRAWHLGVLYQFAKQYPGTDHILNHAWGDVGQTIGFNFDAALVLDTEPEDAVLDEGGFGELNRQIVENHGGMYWLWVNAVVPADSPAAKALRERRLQDVSTGSLLYEAQYICPDCSEALGREVDFYEKYWDDEDKRYKFTCPHLVPSIWAHWLASYFGEEWNFARYAIMKGRNQTVELSQCVDGMLPAAGVIRHWQGGQDEQ